MTKTEDQRPKTERAGRTTHEVAAIILAAGRSERMGAFKPLLRFGSKTVIETCIENLRGGGVETIVVVVGLGQRAEALRDHLQTARVTIVVNPDPQSEMSASIAAGVLGLPKLTKVVLVNPVDHAAVPPKVVELLIQEWKNGARLVKPICNERGGHPALIDMDFRDELINLDPNRGLKGLFELHKEQVARVPVNSDYVARDMDTWDDYCALHLEVFGVPPPKQPAREGV